MDLPVNYDEIAIYKRKIVREEYIKQQNGLCWFCLKTLGNESTDKRKINLKLFPKGFFKYPVHLHHDHNTGMTIGAVHNKCNAILWQYKGE